MNCKPNDLAVIVRTAGKAGEERYLGAILRVLTLNAEKTSQWDTPIWDFEPVSPILLEAPNLCVLDCVLRPIRDPGDDATDESNAWLPPVSSHFKEPA